jgi:hypothetical protein
VAIGVVMGTAAAPASADLVLEPEMPGYESWGRGHIEGRGIDQSKTLWNW